MNRIRFIRRYDPQSLLRTTERRSSHSVPYQVRNDTAANGMRFRLQFLPTGAFLTALSLMATLVLLSTATLPTVEAQRFNVPFTQFQLDNGLRVVLSEDHSSPVVAVVVCYDVGSRNEVKGRTGFAHLFEHMMFQGSENVGKAEQFKYVEGNGGVLNASTFQDHTIFHNLLPSNQLELALWLESDRMRSLKITEENLKNQKEAVKEEKRLSYDNQAYWPALLKMDEMIFSNWSNSHPTIGSMEDLNAASVADVKAFFDIYYAPNNAVLVIGGDFDSNAARAMVMKYFGSIPRQKTPPPVDVSEPPGVVTKKVEVLDQLAETPALAIGWKIPPRDTPEFYQVMLLKSILFDGESARLYQTLVKEKAVSLDLQAFIEDRRGPGQIAILTKAKPGVPLNTILDLIDKEIDRVKQEGISNEELKKVKNQFRLSRFTCASPLECTSLQSPLGIAMDLAEFTLFDSDPSLINTELDHYLAVTGDQLKAAALKYFDQSNTAVAFIRPVKSDQSASKGGR